MGLKTTGRPLLTMPFVVRTIPSCGSDKRLFNLRSALAYIVFSKFSQSSNNFTIVIPTGLRSINQKRKQNGKIPETLECIKLEIDRGWLIILNSHGTRYMADQFTIEGWNMLRISIFLVRNPEGSTLGVKPRDKETGTDRGPARKSEISSRFSN